MMSILRTKNLGKARFTNPNDAIDDFRNSYKKPVKNLANIFIQYALRAKKCGIPNVGLIYEELEPLSKTPMNQ